MQKPADDINKTNQISLIEQWFARIIEDIPCMDDDPIDLNIIIYLIFEIYSFVLGEMVNLMQVNTSSFLELTQFLNMSLLRSKY